MTTHFGAKATGSTGSFPKAGESAGAPAAARAPRRARDRSAAVSGALAALALAVGLPGGAAAQNPDPIREVHGDWEVRCPQPDNCYMIQVRTDETGQPLLLFRMRKLEQPVTTNGKEFIVEAEIFTRLGFFLPGGIRMRVDEGPADRIPFERCIANGCGSLPLFSQAVIDSMRSGGEAVFSMLSEPGQQLDARISLIGFTAAYNAL